MVNDSVRYNIFVGVNIGNIDPPLRSTIRTRFSSLRFMKAVKQFNPIQRGYIERHDLGNLLRMPEHLMIPLHLLQWLVFHTSSLEGSPDEMFFRKRDKRIDFRKGMVDRVFGFNHGNIPFTLESDDPEVVREVEELRS